MFVCGTLQTDCILPISSLAEPLVNMLSVEEVRSKELAAVVVARLSRANATVSLAIAEAGGIEPLVMLVKAGGSSVAQLQAAAALAEVAHVPDNRDKVADAGGIKPLVNCLSSTVAGTPETAALALASTRDRPPETLCRVVSSL